MTRNLRKLPRTRSDGRLFRLWTWEILGEESWKIKVLGEEFQSWSHQLHLNCQRLSTSGTLCIQHILCTHFVYIKCVHKYKTSIFETCLKVYSRSLGRAPHLGTSGVGIEEPRAGWMNSLWQAWRQYLLRIQLHNADDLADMVEVELGESCLAGHVQHRQQNTLAGRTADFVAVVIIHHNAVGDVQCRLLLIGC